MNIEIAIKLNAGWKTEPTTNPLKLIKFLRNVDTNHLRLNWAILHDGKFVWSRDEDKIAKRANASRKINSRVRAHAEIEAKRQGNLIWIQTGGYDHVDHVRWLNKPEQVEVKLMVRTINEFVCGIGTGDGECSHSTEFLTPAEATNATHGTRDLAMEAYENGHPYSIHDGDI